MREPVGAGAEVVILAQVDQTCATPAICGRDTRVDSDLFAFARLFCFHREFLDIFVVAILFRRVVRVIVSVLAVEFSTTRAVDHDAKDVVVTQGLHRARNRIDRGVTDTDHEQRAVA